MDPYRVVVTTHEPVAVWAPDAERIQLVIDDSTVVEMTKDGEWFRTNRPEGARRYSFRIDGSDQALPDPRSPRQPDGVHEASAFWSPDGFVWTDSSWAGVPVQGSVIYELHIGTFTPEGTFDAAIARLDHLVSLGVDLVEIMPVNAFNGTHGWGYDGVDWYAVHETYGGPDGLMRFVDACHARGLGVVLDVVYNHLGPSGNYLPRFGPYLSDGSNSWGQTPNLDGAHSDEVRAYIIDNALRWFREFHIDALRLDAVHALVDHTAVHILEELAVRTEALSRELGRPLGLIAESDLNAPQLITGRERGGFGLTAQWNDDVHHAIHVNVSGETQGYYADFQGLQALQKVLQEGYFHALTYSSFRGRRHGRPIDREHTPASALVVYTCDHDQVGNRALGDRPSAYLTPGQLAVKAALVLLSPFTAMLFMGEEWGASTPFQFFTSHPEAELGKATAEGRKSEFAAHGWNSEDIPDPQDPATFTRSKLDWSELDVSPHREILEFYTALIELRKTTPEFAADTFDSVSVDVDPDAGWLVMKRGTMAVLCSFGDTATTVPLHIAPVLSYALIADTPEGTALGGHNVAVGRMVA